MIINSISIRSKLILTTLVVVLLLTLLSLIFLDASRQVDIQAELLQERTLLNSDLQVLNRDLIHVLTDQDSKAVPAILNQVRKVEGQLLVLTQQKNLAQHEGFERISEQMLTTLEQLAKSVRQFNKADSSHAARVRIDLVIMQELMVDMDSFLSALYAQKRKKRNAQMGLSMALGIFLLANYMIVFTMGLGGSFKKLLNYTGKLKDGKLPAPLEFTSSDEFGMLAQNLNRHATDQQKKIGLINSMSQDGYNEIYRPDAEDELGNALVILSDFMVRKELEEVTRNREDKKRNWISEGFAQLGEVLRTERENVTELSYLIIQKLVTYMHLEMGSLFIANYADPDHPSLDLAASYAYDRRKYNTTNLEWGAGLPGTCAQEKESIFLSDVPDDYFEVSSGTGASKPNCILLVPLKIDEVVYGVIELATIKLLRPFEIEFVESLSERIASSITAVHISERTSDLLKQSQLQAEALQSKDSTMQENMQKLKQAQEDSSKKELEITEILNAINQSTLVAELGLNGRYTSINDQFLMLLESQRDQVLGKLHSDFAQTDAYSDDYKAFWANLKEGQTVSNTELYTLFSGKKVWLQQTFTPIINNAGRVYKILNIAVDMTESRDLQERLESREQEITRSGLDMQTLNKGVNASLIKCELDAEGIIMAVNDNYNEVTGYSKKELLGRNYRLFLKDTEKDQFEKIWNQVVKEKVYEGVIRRSKPTGEEVWLVATFSPVKDEEGVIYKVYFMGLDITEKKLKYQLLEDANKEIERLKEQLKG